MPASKYLLAATFFLMGVMATILAALAFVIVQIAKAMPLTPPPVFPPVGNQTVWAAQWETAVDGELVVGKGLELVVATVTTMLLLFILIKVTLALLYQPNNCCCTKHGYKACQWKSSNEESPLLVERTVGTNQGV
jgi:hypothetical protein